MRAEIPPDRWALSDDERLRTQRVAGSARLAAVLRDGRTRLARLRESGAAKIRLPDAPDGPLEAILINTAGGLTGGDRLAWRVTLGAGASAVVTTQACEKIYRAACGHAQVDAAIDAGPGSRVAWLPQETILYDRSALLRTLTADLAPGATGLFAEAVIFGRRAMGETVRSARFRDRWRIRVGGRLVHADDLAFGPDVADLLRRPAIAAGARAIATILLIDDACEARLDGARAIIGEAGGASAWSVGGCGKLLARLVADDGYSLRKRLAPLLELLNGKAGLPKVWSL